MDSPGGIEHAVERNADDEAYWELQASMREDHLLAIEALLEQPYLIGQCVSVMRDRLLMIQTWLTQDRCSPPFLCSLGTIATATAIPTGPPDLRSQIFKSSRLGDATSSISWRKSSRHTR